MKKRIFAGILWIVSGLLLCLWGQRMMKRDCYLCGTSQTGMKAVCRSMEAPVLLRMNLWEFRELREEQMDEQNQIQVSVRGEAHGMLLVRPKERGCRFEIMPQKGDELDWKLVRERFCEKCCRKMTEFEKILEENMWDLFLADPDTMRIFPIGAGGVWSLADYQVWVTLEDQRIRGEVTRTE